MCNDGDLYWTGYDSDLAPNSNTRPANAQIRYAIGYSIEIKPSLESHERESHSELRSH
jgi:hypothetical protein